MSKDWSENPTQREYEMQRAAEALRKKPKTKVAPESPCRKRNQALEEARTDEISKYRALMRRPYREICDFKAKNPAEWKRLSERFALPQYETPWSNDGK